MDNPQADEAHPPNRAARRHPQSETADKLADNPLAGKLLVTVAEAQEILSLSRTRIYALIQSGELKSVAFGRRRMIPTKELDALVGRKIAEAA